MILPVMLGERLA